jgi:membrane-associated phospholipid phosphatase
MRVPGTAGKYRRFLTMPITVSPTRTDIVIAQAIARHTTPAAERASEVMTWGADEHVLCAIALGWWLLSGRQPARRQASTHILLTTLTAAAVPHLLKAVFDQERPDRLTVLGHINGVPVSGRSLDAFPSGHAVHIGALASAAAELPPPMRNLCWTAAAALVATRVVLLAHWTSDVVSGVAIGVGVERALRYITGYGRHRTARRTRWTIQWKD